MYVEPDLITMIIQRFESDLLLIAQADHAALAARIMTAWRADGFPERPGRARVLEATRLHDIGWQVVDAAPGVDPDTGAPYDVINVPLAIRQGAWPRAVDQLAPQDPYVATLVAQHALTVYRRYASAPEWNEFFSDMERRRDDLFATQALDRDSFLQDYATVGMGDRWSLVFCYGWQEPDEREGYRAKLHSGTIPRELASDGLQQPADVQAKVHPSLISREYADVCVVPGGWLEITPDPFKGASVPLEVPAWRVPARRYASDADLREAMSQAPIVHLTGLASGAPPATILP